MRALQELLQTGLRILTEGFGREIRENRLVDAQNHGLRSLEARLAENGAENRLHGVGENRRAFGAARLQFAFTHVEEGRDVDALGNFVQRLLADEVCAHAREVAFGEVRVAQKERIADHAIEHRVAQKFKTFVVFGRVAAVRDGAPQELLILEAVADSLLKNAQRKHV